VASLTVTPNNDATTLANALLGSGITISNETYTGAASAAGGFAGGVSAGIGIEQGIILSSGAVEDAVGPNDNDGTTTAYFTAGDTDLDSLAGVSTHDAAVLEFDFTSQGDSLYFNFVFASEEYNEFVYQFNDAFGFFLDGVNIALIPGTSIPISIDTVNGGNPFGDANASYPQYFNNNDFDDGGPFFDIEYDGFTDVFTAQALNLSPGQHHLKLAVADAGDNSLDSAVFIQGGSLSDNPLPPNGDVPEPATVVVWSVLLGIGLVFTQRRRRSKERPTCYLPSASPN